MVRTACTEPQCLYKGALYLFTVTELIHGENNSYFYKRDFWFFLNKLSCVELCAVTKDVLI